MIAFNRTGKRPLGAPLPRLDSSLERPRHGHDVGETAQDGERPPTQAQVQAHGAPMVAHPHVRPHRFGILRQARPCAGVRSGRPVPRTRPRPLELGPNPTPKAITRTAATRPAVLVAPKAEPASAALRVSPCRTPTAASGLGRCPSFKLFPIQRPTFARFHVVAIGKQASLVVVFMFQESVEVPTSTVND